MKSLNTPHDKGYKWLLSSREIFIQLLQSFINEPWVEELDQSQIKRTEKSFIAKDFLEKEADLVYEATLNEQTVVFYILLELQRKVDFSMPYRLLNYMNGIWKNYLNLLPQKETIMQKDFLMPAIVPIIIYNGDQPWTAVRSFQEMLAGGGKFGNRVLNFEYILLDVKRYEDDELLALSNTVGAAFLLDKNSCNRRDLRQILKQLFSVLQDAPERELIIFMRWLQYIIQPRLSAAQQEMFEEELSRLDNKEVKKVLFMNLEKSLDNLEKEAREEGREEGREITALELLREKVDINVISKCTKLSIDKIHDLMKKL